MDYVGQPILDECPANIDERGDAVDWKENEDHPVVGLVPGSRKEEIKNLLPYMLKSAEMIARRYHNARFILPLAPTLEAAFVKTYIDHSKVAVEVIEGGIYHALRRCHAAMVTSGTATLETAITAIPMVVVYKGSPVSYWIAKQLVDVPFISLVNLVAGQEVVKELIQNDVTVERLAYEALLVLEDKETERT